MLDKVPQGFMNVLALIVHDGLMDLGLGQWIQLQVVVHFPGNLVTKQIPNGDKVLKRKDYKPFRVLNGLAEEGGCRQSGLGCVNAATDQMK